MTKFLRSPSGSSKSCLLYTSGKGVCIVYVDEQTRPKTATLDPRQAFVVYDDTVAHRPLAGIHFYARVNERGKTNGLHVYGYDAARRMHWETRGNARITGAPETETTYFGGVPMVEFWNNAVEAGDFGPGLSLIEAYDTLESDRMNVKQ